MLRNNLKISLRNLLRHKGYSFINIAGLAIGMAVCLLMLFYLRHELTYDSFHGNADKIYRVAEHIHRADGFNRSRANTGTPLAPLVQDYFPDVRAAVRFSIWEGIVSTGASCFRERQFCFADSTVFSVFTFLLAAGDPDRALAGPNKVVLTEKAAQKYFGDENPVGRTLRFDNTMDFTVTGILKPIPSNSHLQFDFLASFETLEHTYNGWSEHWDAPVSTYLLLDDNADPAKVESQFPAFTAKYRPADESSTVTYWLQPLAKIHLTWDTPGLALYLFPAIALFILALAVINYVNLSTARSARRAREVGIRKVVGAHRSRLAGQFILESVVISLIAMPLAVALAELLLPVFNAVTDIRLTLDYFSSLYIVPGLLAVTILVGVLSGWYPAFVLSAFRPITVIRGVLSGGRFGFRLRAGLVVFQFMIAIALIFASIVAHNQMTFLYTKDLGFGREAVVVVPLEDPAVRRNYATLKSEWAGQSGVLSVTAASDMPGGIDCRGLTYCVAGSTNLVNIPTAWVDFDYIKTMEIQLTDGRDFNAEIAADGGSAFILNQSAVKYLGLGDGIGRSLEAFPNPSSQEKPWHAGQVIGITEDFHFRYLHYQMQPLVMIVNPERCAYLLARLDPLNIPSTIAALKQSWQEIVPESPFEFSFLDDEINRLYRSEERFAAVIRYAGFLAILVACLGVLGLASFIAETRTKEISIRKVHGASAARIVGMLSGRFALYVVLAGFMASPVAYYAMRYWLQNFVYRTHIGIGPFILAVSLALIIALLTVCVQAVRAALANPVNALRHE